MCLMFHLLHISSYGWPTYSGPMPVIISSGGPDMLNQCADLLAIAVLAVE